jgi:hypothetical protein
MTLGTDQSVTFAGTQTYTGAATFTAGITVQGLTVGKGAGAVATNTAVGASALAANTSGAQNTGVGREALLSNTTGTANTAVGEDALVYTTTGSNNTAHGARALFSNTTASNNTAVGYQAGYSNTTANGSTFVGYQAGYSSNYTSGNTYNTFVGFQAGYSVTTGNRNVIIGNYSGNAGGLDIRTFSNYIVLSDGDGNPRLFYSNSASTWVSTEIYASTTASGANMFVGSNGAIQRSTSALKYKQDIRDIEEIDINLLRGVRYKSKCEGDDQTKDHFGIVADEVDAVGIKELVSYGANGEVEGFQYERLTVVLLKKLQTLDAEFKAYVATHP